MNHIGYVLIVIFVLGYSLFSYLKRRVGKVVINLDQQYVELILYNLTGKKFVRINADNLKYDLRDKVGSRGFKYKQILITLNGEVAKITGEKEGWTNKKVEELSVSLLKLKELGKSP